MTFTIQTVARSLADYLSPVLPGVTFYEDPNQQGSEMPCAFLQQRYAYIELRPGRRWLRRIGLDLTCLEDYHLPGLQRRYQAAAEALDLVLETFPYSDGQERALLRTYEREWRIDADALHYKFELQVFVSRPEVQALMEHMDYHGEVRDETENLYPRGPAAEQALRRVSAGLPEGGPV